ncbi:MAG: hypothetical protein HQL63_00155 [Magnetococcales bacterium]|nr:hypothetical protein [Magnetococcales bacterium]MBF0323394.1 hypothetical protein [Magnetococcales bacterium]
MKRQSVTVTDENFPALYGLVRDLIETFRLHAENWVLDQFREIPEIPSITAVAALQSWVDHCVSTEFIHKLVALLEERENAPERRRTDVSVSLRQD